MKYPITTQVTIRRMFWNDYPEFKRRAGWTQNDYPADIRLQFCIFVDMLHRSGSMSDDLAGRATL
jgi:hypothetical protein